MISAATVQYATLYIFRLIECISVCINTQSWPQECDIRWTIADFFKNLSLRTKYKLQSEMAKEKLHVSTGSL